jgi:hypothetical protein
MPFEISSDMLNILIVFGMLHRTVAATGFISLTFSETEELTLLLLFLTLKLIDFSIIVPMLCNHLKAFLQS